MDNTARTMSVAEVAGLLGITGSSLRRIAHREDFPQKIAGTETWAETRWSETEIVNWMQTRAQRQANIPTYVVIDGQQEEVVTCDYIQGAIGRSDSFIYTWAKRNKFPPPIMLEGYRCKNYWFKSDIYEWLQANRKGLPLSGPWKAQQQTKYEVMTFPLPLPGMKKLPTPKEAQLPLTLPKAKEQTGTRHTIPEDAVNLMALVAERRDSMTPEEFQACPKIRTLVSAVIKILLDK